MGTTGPVECGSIAQTAGVCSAYKHVSGSPGVSSVDACLAKIQQECPSCNYFSYRKSNGACHKGSGSDPDCDKWNTAGYTSDTNIYRACPATPQIQDGTPPVDDGTPPILDGTPPIADGTPPDWVVKPCSGSCYSSKGVLNPSKQCGKSKCEGCCECTGKCPPTEKPASSECDDKCYSKKGVLNPSKKCPKSKCAGCCECTGDCINWDDLEDYEKGNEISDVHQPEYECAKWCYSKKHKNKPWEKKCNLYACSTCSECPDEEEETPEEELHQTEMGAESCPGVALTSTECEAAAVSLSIPWDRVDEWSNGPAGCFTNGKKVYSNTKKDGASSNPKWRLICHAVGEEEDGEAEPSCDEDKCFKENGKLKKGSCEKIKCAACAGCGEEDPEAKPSCDDDKCFNKKNRKLKQGLCKQNKCAACAGCGENQEKPDRTQCEDKCYDKKGVKRRHV